MDTEDIEMAEDYLLEAVAGALQGFERAYLPAKQAQFQDELAQRRTAQTNQLLRQREQEQSELEFQDFQRRLPLQEESQMRIAQARTERPESTKTTGIFNRSGQKVSEYSGDVEFLPEVETTKKTIGENAVDREFGKEYANYIAGGGYSSIVKNLNQLRDVRNKLKKTNTATGGVVGLLGKPLRDIVTPQGASLQDQVEEVVQTNLRKILGGQFSEREGKQLVQRSYNPRLPESENSMRLERLIKQIEQAAFAKDEAVKYFEKNGTLKGFSGKLYQSVSDFSSEESSDMMPSVETKNFSEADQLLQELENEISGK